MGGTRKQGEDRGAPHPSLRCEGEGVSKLLLMPSFVIIVEREGSESYIIEP